MVAWYVDLIMLFTFCSHIFWFISLIVRFFKHKILAQKLGPHLKNDEMDGQLWAVTNSHPACIASSLAIAHAAVTFTLQVIQREGW